MISKEEKRERRQAKHELQAHFRSSLSKTVRLRSTPNQVKQLAKVLADRTISASLNA